MKLALRMTALSLAFLFTASSALQAQATPNYAQIREERAQGLKQPYGWLSLIALEWLHPGITTAGSAPDNSLVIAGAPEHLLSLQAKDDKVYILNVAAGTRLGETPLDAGKNFQEWSDDEDDDAALARGTLRLWAIDRGGKRYLRVKDSAAPALKNFHGLKWYAPDAHYRVEAHWVPYTSPHTLQVMNKIGQVIPTPVPGYVEFTLDGKKQTLTPIESDDNHLWFVFRDETYTKDTDSGGRFLVTTGPSNGIARPGTVWLDFNESENPPCAYSPYATCPLASPENRLPISVPAGEKRYEN